MENKFYEPEELTAILNRTKLFLDRAYLETKLKYNSQQSNSAMYEFFINYDYGMFTNAETRKKFHEFTYHGNEITQILLDFAISSYIVDRQNGIEPKVSSYAETHPYTNMDNKDLNYDPKYITEIVAIATATKGPYFVINLLACNTELKIALVRQFITERYNIKDRKQALDNSKNMALIKLSDKQITMSKNQLNRDIDNMNNDDEYEIGYFDPENLKITQSENKESHLK